MPEITFTYTFVEAVTSQDKDRIDYNDKSESGLQLRVTKYGRKTFCFRYNYKGKTKRYTIGTYPAVSLGDARSEVIKLKGIIDKGKDPQYEKLLERERPEPATVKDLADRFIRHHLPKLKESTQITYKNRIESEIVPAFGKLRLEDLNRAEIIEFLEEIAIERNHPIHSNRCRSILSSMLSFAVQKDLIDFNIMKTIKPVAKENTRDRVYNDTEIRAIWMAFEDQKDPVQSVFKILLMLGQRMGETLRMQWSHINNGVWTIPVEDTKGKRTHFVPLNEKAMEVIEAVRPLTGASDYVFESWINHGHHMTHLADAAERIATLSGVNDFRVHDLRRTAASNMARLGTDRTVLGKILNHKGLSGDSAITAVYDRYEYMDEKRRALSLWEIALTFFTEKKMDVERLYELMNGKKEARKLVSKIVNNPKTRQIIFDELERIEEMEKSRIKEKNVLNLN